MANKTKKNFRRNTGKRRDRRDEKTCGNGASMGEKKYNDVSWYAKNEAMLRDAASFSYNNPLGGLVKPDRLWVATDLDYTYAAKSVSGLMSYEFLPTPGKTDTSTSPANLAAQNIYTYVRYMNSGSKNYDQADLMLYLLAMDNIYMFWNWCKRMYGYAFVYSQKNKYMPLAYAAADKVDLDDLHANLSDMREWLNKLAAQISSFCVPAVMPYFVRHSWMVSNIYTDGMTSKAQHYMFVPGGFYKYNETGSKYGGKLDLLRGGGMATKPQTFAQIRALGKVLLDAVSYSEDVGVMSGDILKAYGQEQLFKLAPVDPEYQVLPVYNEEVLMQMENSSIVTLNTSFTAEDSTGFRVWNDMSISQDPNTGYLVWKPKLIPIAFRKVGTIINMRKDEVTPADTMVATRLTACQNGDQLTAVGTELIYRWETFRFDSAGSKIVDRSWDQVCNLGDLGTALGAEVALNAVAQLCELTEFDRHPLIPVFATFDGKSRYLGTVGDLANYTVVSSEDLEQMHGTAIMSEFNIPQIGSF